jgi:hypothetical protein
MDEKLEELERTAIVYVVDVVGKKRTVTSKMRNAIIVSIVAEYFCMHTF